MGYIIAPAIVHTDVDGELVLLDAEKGEYFGLNETGAHVWRAISRFGDPESACAKLVAEYDVDAEMVSRDVDRIVAELCDADLVLSTPDE